MQIIASPEALLAAFPNGPDTECKAGDVEMTARAAEKLLKADDFPNEAYIFYFLFNAPKTLYQRIAK